MNTPELKEEIKRHEGEVLSIYKDTLGYLTLGVGHLVVKGDPEYGEPEGTEITQEASDAYFDHDFVKHLDETLRVYGDDAAFYELPDVVQHTLVNMCFNLGPTGLSKFKNTLKMCREGNWEAMADGMMDSRWYNQVGRRGEELVERIRDIA